MPPHTPHERYFMLMNYTAYTWFFSFFTALVAAVIFSRYVRSADQATVMRNFPLAITLFVAWIFFGNIPLTILLAYFGLPKFLTFGYQIGSVLPTDCEASMAVEGPDGVPCSGKRSVAWVGKVFSADGSLHLDDFEAQ